MTGVKRQIKRLLEDTVAAFAPLTWRRGSVPRLLVLMYHRVLPDGHPDRALEQPGMYVSPTTLDLHLRILKRHFPIVQIEDWARSAAAGESLPPQACALTFDDGWRDNFEHAFPVLSRHAAPATIFLVSSMTDTGQEFWPNRLARALARLQPGESLPGPLGGVVADVVAHARAAGQWSLADLDRAIVLVKRLGEAEIQSSLDEAQARRGEAAADTRAVLNRSELGAMAASGLIRFGSHTRTHLRFRGQQPAAILEQEIAGSRAEIEQSVGAAATSVFCYPNGDTTAAAVEVVRRHYTAAVTTEKGWHQLGADPWLIRRIGVHEDISNRRSAFVARITGLP